ncbi:hypothetical protein WA026_001838, partial [Henosepilachna vigintioctopunctata]
LKNTDETINYQGARRKKWVYVGRIIGKEVLETTIETYIKCEVQDDVEVKSWKLRVRTLHSLSTSRPRRTTKEFAVHISDLMALW